MTRLEWLPSDAAVPDERRTDRVLLRPLRATDVERDYDAVLSSRAMLRQWSQSDWPADGFTLAENLADLERHEREHRERVAFTYTVLDPAADRCLGCVYLSPLGPREAAWGEGGSAVARVAFWVREDEIGSDLDRHLLRTLLDWFREWPFDRVLFTTSPGDARQIALFEDAGLPAKDEVVRPDGRRLLAYFGGGRA